MLAIIGTVGIPAAYGGFETLAENLAIYNEEVGGNCDLTVYCSSRAGGQRIERYRGASLRYINLEANGVQSIVYDAMSLVDAVRGGHDRLLMLGVSGAVILPLMRLFTKARIITNVDGIEWKREKWRGLGRLYLRLAECLAVRFSHEVVADNQAIADYIAKEYGRSASVIPYGGDHAVKFAPDATYVSGLPENYALALCRIEPENNIEMILKAFDGSKAPLVVVGNWDNSNFGRELKARYSNHPTITIRDPVYEPRGLRAIRDRATLYVHGHKAGGTNPALVEMMHFGIPVAAFDCSFNRHTTEDRALFFSSSGQLREIVAGLNENTGASIGAAMQDIARRRYTWDAIGHAYFELLGEEC